MAIAAGVAAAAATAVAAGVGAASSAGAFGGGPEKPEFEQVPKRPFETAQQKYMSRVMMANLANRGPSYQEWLESGGKAKFELTGLGMTPAEARKLGFVGPGGRAPEWVQPATVGETGLTPEQFIYSGQEAAKGKGPAARIGRIQTRIERLQGMPELRPGQEKRLGRLQERKERLMGRFYRGEGEV
jgi:hypothetical protein